MSLNRRGFVRQMVFGGGGCLVSSRALAIQSGRPFVCRIIDKQSGQPLSARVRLVDTHGQEVAPIGHRPTLVKDAQEGDVRFQSRRYSYVDGAFEIDPSTLPLNYQVIKGYEYLFAEGVLSTDNLAGGCFTIPLTRWSNISAQGWYSGDIHIHHISPKSCRLEMDAEDLNVANILTSDFTEDQDSFDGKINGFSAGNRLIYVNQEFRNDELGHLNLLNLKSLIQPVKPMRHDHYPLHLEVCDKTHAQGGYVSWAHFPSWPGVESPLDVAMAKLDGLEILCVLEPREMPIFMKQVIPELAANDGLRLWYRFLNCGFRLTATAGTDKMTTFVTVGANRVFAQLEKGFTYQGWIDALKAGRTFITNSPILFFTVNGRQPGSVLALNPPKDKAVQIHATVESQLPYHRLEIVRNGRVIAEASPSGPRNRAEIYLESPLKQSCWFAARALEDLTVYRRQDLSFSMVHADKGTLLSNYFGTRRPETVFAHSSPVYVILDDKPIRSWEDAQYYVRYLDNCIQWLKTEAKFSKPSDKERSIEAFLKGRAIYEKRAQEALRA